MLLACWQAREVGQSRLNGAVRGLIAPARPITSPVPPDMSWRTEYPYVQMDSTPKSASNGLRPSSSVDFLTLTPLEGRRTPTVVPPSYSGGILLGATSPPQWNMRQTASTGSFPLRGGEQQCADSSADGRMWGRSAAAEARDAPYDSAQGCGGAQGSCNYLQRLPLVLRRSVCSTGVRQHTCAVYEGLRERDSQRRDGQRLDGESD